MSGNGTTIAIMGTGLIAHDHAKAIASLGYTPCLISRSVERAKEIESTTGFDCIGGGIAGYKAAGKPFDRVVVALPIQASAEVTKECILAGAKELFLEKPAALTCNELVDLNSIADEHNAHCYIAYNRRFFSSVLKLKELIEQDGGATSFTFDFTEWGHVIGPLATMDATVKSNLILANSSHVIDMAFHLGGWPKEISIYGKGVDNLPWHPSRAQYSGAGTTNEGAVFAFHANWESGGRWSVEVCTKAAKYILRPLEKLQIMPRGKIDITEIEIDDSNDKNFKPGFLLQMRAFLTRDSGFENLCMLKDQVKHAELYKRIAGL